MKPTEGGLVPVRSKQSQEERFAYIRETYPTTPPKETPLSMKYKQAIILQWKHTMTNQQIADYIGVAKDTYSQRKYCDDAKNFRKSLDKLDKDSDRLIPILVVEQGERALVDLVTCKDTLMAMGQWEAAGKLNIKLLELAGYPKKSLINVDSEAKDITINVVSIEKFDSSPTIETDFELLSGTD